MDNNIRFTEASIDSKDIEQVLNLLRDSKKISGDGEITKKCQSWMEENFNYRKVLLTNSCTAALEMAAILTDLKPGDEVIMPSFTFVSTANAFVLRGAIPVFVDINPKTLNISIEQVAKAITTKTKAIVPVHYASLPCEMERILDLAKQKNLYVIEDAAQAIWVKNEQGYMGGIGDLGAISFHDTKNVISGEGGALVINNDKFLERAELIWEKGTNRRKFLKGEVDKYSWVDVGSSFLPSELTASLLFSQLQKSKNICDYRISLSRRYYEYLSNDLKKYEIGFFEDYSKANGHMFYLILRSVEECRKLRHHLNSNQIQSVTHYVPLHNSEAGKKYGKISGTMNHTDSISERLLRLPLHSNLKIEDIDYISKKVLEFSF